jgi:hypothetical protein
MVSGDRRGWSGLVGAGRGCRGPSVRGLGVLATVVRVRLHLVGSLAPLLDDAASLDKVRKHLLTKAFVPEFVVEALHEGVLIRLPDGDVVPLAPTRLIHSSTARVVISVPPGTCMDGRSPRVFCSIELSRQSLVVMYPACLCGRFDHWPRRRLRRGSQSSLWMRRCSTRVWPASWRDDNSTLRCIARRDGGIREPRAKSVGEGPRFSDVPRGNGTYS